MSTKPLPHRRQMFALEYARDGNGARAYVAAGYRARNNAAETCASRLLRDAQVAAEVARLRAASIKKAKTELGLTLERLTQEVARGAFFDVRRLVNEDGTPKALHELDDDTASAIAGIELEEIFDGKGLERKHVGRIHKFKLVDRKAFVDMGIRVIGGYKEDNKQQNAGEALADMLKDMKRSALPVVARVEADDSL